MAFDTPEYSNTNEVVNSALSFGADKLSAFATNLGYKDTAEYLDFHAEKFDRKAQQMAEITANRERMASERRAQEEQLAREEAARRAREEADQEFAAREAATLEAAEDAYQRGAEIWKDGHHFEDAGDMADVALYQPEMAVNYVAQLALDHQTMNAGDENMLAINRNVEDGLRHKALEYHNNPDIDPGEAREMQFADAREAYDSLNNAPVIQKENFRLAMEAIKNGDGPHPRINGLGRDMQKELFNVYWEQGGNAVNWMIALPESRIVPGEQMDIVGRYMADTIKGDPGNAFRFRHILLGPNGMLTNPRLNAQYVEQIANNYLPYIKKNGFDHGTIGYDLMHALQNRDWFTKDSKDTQKVFAQMEAEYEERRASEIKT